MSEIKQLAELIAKLAQNGGGQGGAVSSSGSGLQQIGLNGQARAGRRSAPVVIGSHGVEVDSSRPVQVLGHRVPDGALIRAKLAGAATTVYATGCYVVSKAGRVIETLTFSVNLTSTTEQTLVPAAANGRVHTLQSINIYNADASTQTVTVEEYVSAAKPWVKQLVPTGETLCWQNGLWTVTYRGTPIPVSAGGTGLATLAAGSMLYGAGTNPMVALAIGTAGQILQVNAGATAPTWNSMSGDGTLSSAGVLALTKSTGPFSLQSTVALEGDIAWTVSADTNDAAPTGLSGASVIKAAASGAGRNITGLTGGADGRVITFINTGSLFLTLKNESSSSSAANRFALGSTDISLWTGDSVILMYDSSASRWRCVASQICQPKFGVYPSGTKSSSSGSFTSPDWNTKDFDSHGWFDNATNYRYTPLLPGKYLFSFRVGIAGVTDADECLCSLFTNKTGSSAETARSLQFTSGGANDVCLSGSAIIVMDGVDDWVQCQGYQASGGALNLQAGPLRTYFSGVRIGD